MPRAKRSDKRFPLRLHQTGQWTKKVRGRSHYFGTDRDDAAKRYYAVKDDLEAGRTPRPRSGDGPTVAELANVFLTARRRDVDAGELSGRQWSEYHATCEAVVSAFGRTHPVATLEPDDFGRLRGRAAKRLGPYALAKFVQMVRTLFAFGFANDHLPVPVKYGTQFDKPPVRVLRLKRAAGPAKVPSPADCRKLIGKAAPQTRAMILLALNGGFGPTDLANLDRADVARRPGWLDLTRRKTGVARRCPLWPETVRALAAVEKVRPAPKDPADADAVFLTYKGRRWVRYADRGPESRGVRSDSVGQHFKMLARECGVKVSGFYALRHAFRTVADEARDAVAIDTVMGHADPGMGAVYRERIADERLLAVVNHVRAWLFPRTTRKV